MKIGQGCRVHLLADELPMGRLIVQVTRHLTAVIDGVIQDVYDPSRSGKRCVYGYWSHEDYRPIEPCQLELFPLEHERSVASQYA